LHVERRETGRALELYGRALAIEEAVYGPSHPWVGTTLYNLGVTAKQAGDVRQALGHFRRCLGIWEEAYGSDHPLVANALTGLGQSLLALDRPGQALAYLERALALRQAHDTEATLLGNTRFALAQALVASGGDAERARSLALAARQAFADGGASTRPELSEVDRWLSIHS
jgi:tetratricopeptide (TPR) repeat protein